MFGYTLLYLFSENSKRKNFWKESFDKERQLRQKASVDYIFERNYPYRQSLIHVLKYKHVRNETKILLFQKIF